MNDYQIEKQFLVSESDVEQKVVYPLLINAEPIGLGYDRTEIQTKNNLQKLIIDKGQKAITYYPDYLLIINGIPSIVVEAKKPGEDMLEAFRQAALYAGEVNRKFDRDINPCQLVIACDGLKLWAGTWDSNKPIFEIETQNWLATNEAFSRFCNMFAKSTLEKTANVIKNSIRTSISFKRPLNLLGGLYIQNQSSKNTFGETLSIQYRHLFNPNIEEERIDIVNNAYVKVMRHESHVSPIDRLIRKKILPLSDEMTLLNDNSQPTEIIRKIKNASSYNNQVLLLIGSVGSGKSTFSTYLKEVALDKSITKKISWVTLDLNNAPVAHSEIYKWIKNNIIVQLQRLNAGLDFDSLKFIQELYDAEISRFLKGSIQLLNPDSDKYRELLVEKIISLQNDLDVTLYSYIDRLVHLQGKELIITLDNCDKRNLAEQLLMFEVASWIKDSIKAIVFLPLRDTTYDHFRREKPLDTVVKDLTFRIVPPSLEKVLYSRIKYAIRLSERQKDRHYFLPNNIKVTYPAKDEMYYLRGILTSLFQNHFFKKLISGLAGVDIRVGLEIFLDFCKSGHISEQEILKMKQTKGEAKLPNHIISKVFLRGNRVYYSDSAARIKNIFFSDPGDKLPDPFVRIGILKWLNDLYRVKGPSGILGFHKVETLLNHLISHGHDKERVINEILTLIKQSLIVSESQKSDSINLSELICISHAGFVHIELMNNIDYLAACSEDTWFNSAEIAGEIANNMAGEGTYAHLSIQNTLSHATLLVNYLESYYNKNFLRYSEFLAPSVFSNPVDFKSIKNSIENFSGNLSKNKFRQLDGGQKFKATVLNVNHLRIVVEINNTEQIGVIYNTYLNGVDLEANFRVNDKIDVEVVKYVQKSRRYTLKLVETNAQ